MTRLLIFCALLALSACSHSVPLEPAGGWGAVERGVACANRVFMDYTCEAQR